MACILMWLPSFVVSLGNSNWSVFAPIVCCRFLSAVRSQWTSRSAALSRLRWSPIRCSCSRTSPSSSWCRCWRCSHGRTGRALDRAFSASTSRRMTSLRSFGVRTWRGSTSYACWRVAVWHRQEWCSPQWSLHLRFRLRLRLPLSYPSTSHRPKPFYFSLPSFVSQTRRAGHTCYSSGSRAHVRNSGYRHCSPAKRDTILQYMVCTS